MRDMRLLANLQKQMSGFDPETLASYVRVWLNGLGTVLLTQGSPDRIRSSAFVNLPTISYRASISTSSARPAGCCDVTDSRVTPYACSGQGG
jgi:hypothetical protein